MKNSFIEQRCKISRKLNFWVPKLNRNFVIINEASRISGILRFARILKFKYGK